MNQKKQQLQQPNVVSTGLIFAQKLTAPSRHQRRSTVSNNISVGTKPSQEFKAKGLIPNKRKIVMQGMSGLLGLCFGAASFAGIILNEGFEDKNAQRWSSDRQSRKNIQLNYFDANTTLKIKQGGFAALNVDTSGFKNVRIAATAYGTSLEGNEQCKVEISSDKNPSWRTITSLANGSDDGFSPATGVIYDAKADDNAKLIVRLSLNGDSNNDQCFFDNIQVRGESIYPLTLPQGQSLNASLFNTAESFQHPLSYQYFSPQKGALTASNKWPGTLSLNNNQKMSVDIIEDTFAYQADYSNNEITQFPKFTAEFVQYGDRLIPKQRGAQAGEHTHWEVIFETGKIWDQQGDQGFSRAALPFALQQKGANCIHNGVMTFLYKENGEISRSLMQIGSETCSYFKFDAWASLTPQLSNLQFSNTQSSNTQLHQDADAVQHLLSKQSIIKQYQQELAQRLPIKAISELKTQYPQVSLKQIGSTNEVHPSSMTAYGMVAGGVHYVSECITRFGAYPFCDELVLPSYSTAKSITGLAYLAAIKRYPEFKGMSIASLVPQCSNSSWESVTVEDALNMTTGHYVNSGYEVDEYQSMSNFFDANTHAEKIDAACAFASQILAGKKWVYHTSDTYLFATALQNFWQQKNGAKSDYYEGLMLPLWKKIGLGPLLDHSRRSYDKRRQVYAGYGLTYHRNDIAKLAQHLLPNTKTLLELGENLDAQELAKALQMNGGNFGVNAAKNTNYQHAFWAWNAQSVLSCEQEVWIPFMSGFGGITVAMLPNNTVYYYFSDDHNYLWRDAVLQANAISPLCPRGESSWPKNTP